MKMRGNNKIAVTPRNKIRAIPFHLRNLEIELEEIALLVFLYDG